jgi:periplasmic protein TonB
VPHMFDIPQPANRRRRAALTASVLVHCVVVYLWLNRAPMFVQPSSVAWGLHGNSANLIYFPRVAEHESPAKKLHFRAMTTHKPAIEPPPQVVESARAGAPEGSLAQGPVTGVEASPALPLVFPDPSIYPWQLPKGLQGDVIVEVTIDEQGKVTETKVVQSLQSDIDDKVIATLKNWRFKPASVDGVAISSRQDVHFHFPS